MMDGLAMMPALVEAVKGAGFEAGLTLVPNSAQLELFCPTYDPT
jgi:hypothetical protein